MNITHPINLMRRRRYPLFHLFENISFIKINLKLLQQLRILLQECLFVMVFFLFKNVLNYGISM